MHPILLQIEQSATTAVGAAATVVADTTQKLVGPPIRPEIRMNIFELIMKGGWIMVPIGILLFLTIFIIIERVLYIRTAGKADANLLNVVRDNLMNGNIKGAQMYCERSTSSQARVIGSGISFIGQNLRDIESAMEDKANIEVSRMEHSVNYLGLIAGIAPMLGFIGTISGVIRIFYEISLTDNISIGIISGGLYEKMITSGAGLIVGVVAYTAYQLLQTRIDRITSRIQESALQLKSILNQPSA